MTGPVKLVLFPPSFLEDNKMLYIGSGSENGSLGFVQQGQVDWVAFSKLAWQASSEILQRFSSANVQPITFGAGIILAEQFRLGPQGQSRMEEAISRIQGVRVFQDLLWLGFGYRSLIGTMTNTVGGVKCIALCACLADIHSEISAASILQELWKAYEFPDQYEPSHKQFLALINVCSGVIVKTPFPQIMDVMLGDMLWKVPDGSSGEIPEASSSRDIAQALRGLFRVSRGEIESITITGGGECAFIAALAHWLFNFKLRVESDEGKPIFGNASEEEALQVHVQYGPVENALLQIRGTTYLLGDFRKAIDKIPDENIDSLLIARTEWNGCLRRVFGVAFLQLLELPNYLGSYLGSLARIYAALAQGEIEVGTLSRLKFYDFSEGSYGQGFIGTIMSTFPELRNVDGLRQNMEVAAEASFEKAFSAVEFSVLALETLCACRECLAIKKQQSADMMVERSCLLGIIYAIREVARIMACVVLDPQDERPLYPTVRGIKHFSRYGKSQRMLRQWGEVASAGVSVTRTAYLGEKTDHAYYAMGLSEKESENWVHFNPVNNVSILFQGPSVRNKSNIFEKGAGLCTALSYHGVCCYVDGLRSLTGDPEAVRLIHVLSGQIRYKDRPYQEVRDGDSGLERRSKSSLYEIAQITPASTGNPDSSDTLIGPGSKKPLSLQARAFESALETTLFCSYRVLTPAGNIDLQPGILMTQILRHTGQIPCSHSSRCRKILALPCSMVRRGWTVDPERTENLTFMSSLACCIWPDRDDVEKCIILELQSLVGTKHLSLNTVFVRRSECLPCCTETVLREGGTITQGNPAGTKVVMQII